MAYLAKESSKSAYSFNQLLSATTAPQRPTPIPQHQQTVRVQVPNNHILTHLLSLLVPKTQVPKYMGTWTLRETFKQVYNAHILQQCSTASRLLSRQPLRLIGFSVPYRTQRKSLQEVQSKNSAQFPKL